MANKMLGKLGSWAFIIGIIIAGIIGLYAAVEFEGGSNIFTMELGGWLAWILAIIGTIVGILAVLGKGTITSKETPGFLLAGIALVVMASAFNGWQGILSPWIGSLLAGVSLSLAIFVAPAVGLLAIRAIYDMGKD
ncbi:MAG: hypothetical protein BV456_04240 [Thermoplasmata archaeon M8B2D]|nr:MAG: hypothetical protein BV456_04240 [Thermoplasmata archaeon M8B2D]